MIAQLMLLAGRAVREPAIQTILALLSVPATASTMRAIGLSAELDASSLANGLAEPALWLTLGLAALFGGLGGIVAELISLHGNIELPHRHKIRKAPKRPRLADPRHEIDLGIFSRMLLGATAALALLAVYSPTNPTALLVNGLIAGSAATGVFRLVQGRMLGKASASEAHVEKPATAKVQLSVVGGTQSSVAQ